MKKIHKTKFADHRQPPLRIPLWLGIGLAGLLAVAIILLGLLSVSIMERRWEAQRPAMIVQPVDAWEPDNTKWGQNYPHQYETYLRTRTADTQTLFGGAVQRDYLEDYPAQVILFAGYGFSKEYLQARGHYYALEDVKNTERLAYPFQAATCWTCKSADVPRTMNEMGTAAFYAANFHDLTDRITHPIGCVDCHDAETMQLRISRPALVEAFAAQGKDISKATLQEMRSLVCAQCHVEYYFAEEPRNYLTLPWKEGTSVEEMIAYYDAFDFADYVHPISKTPIIKSQHPDYELYRHGIHAYRNVACADCHMPYRSEGGMKFTDHHVQSPLLNIANSCAVCHRWSEDEIRTRVESIQTTVSDAMVKAEEALVKAHFDIAAAMQAGADAAALAPLRTRLRHAQFRWDYVSSSNGMGFHAPQESMRILGDATRQAQEVRIEAARLLARHGITDPPSYPDISTRQKAFEVAEAFVNNAPIELLK
ncbi:MAG TPA: ammonia-forming cytochrome c nitrite reductase subunit c552 [Phycisphaerales bacterium]|nr:ammonia-forming cytochrome c nitrite reductase subunit c552 [Phycisphaerales bacterium]